MARKKKPLKIDYVHWCDEEEKALAGELEKRFPILRRCPPVLCPDPYRAVAAVALYPGILATRSDFAECYKRYPDVVIEALRGARQLAANRERNRHQQERNDSLTQAGRVRSFFGSVPAVAKVNGKLVLPADLLRPHRGKWIATSDLSDGEIAQCLSVKGCTVTSDSVRAERQRLVK